MAELFGRKELFMASVILRAAGDMQGGCTEHVSVNSAPPCVARIVRMRSDPLKDEVFASDEVVTRTESDNYALLL